MTDGTLFDPLPEGREPKAKPEPPRRKPVEDDGEESPFGAPTPDGYDPDQSHPDVGFGQAFSKGAPRKKASKSRDHYKRVREHMEERYGGFFWTCDGFAAGAGGRLIARDLLGFMDIQGLDAGGRLIGVNVTSEAQVKPHIREYANPNNTHGQAKIPVPDLLRRFLRCGGRFVIVGYEKVGRNWQLSETWVDEDALLAADARRRPAKGRRR